MQLVVLLCCVAVVVHCVPCVQRVSRKMKETQQQLNDFERSATLQSNSSLLNNSLLIIKPGCCQSALECFHKNLWEVTHPSTRDSTLLFSSLRNTLMKYGVRCTDPDTTPTAASCPSCDSFPKTAVDLVHQLKMFLQRAQTNWSIKCPSGRR